MIQRKGLSKKEGYYISIEMWRIILVLFFLVLPSSLFAENGITASSYLLIEMGSLEVVAGKNYHNKLPPASTTKIMTTILALEKLKGDEQIVPDSKVTAIPRSKLNLIPGKRYLSGDLIKGVMVESANDAAYAVGTHIAGSEERFGVMMTERARALGADNTQFKNASGLPMAGHYTTCYDLALILRHALTIERFPEIASMRYFLFQNHLQSVRYKNHNRFLFCFDPAIAGKTGFTKASRHCYAGAFEKDGKVYILTLLGSRDLWGDAVRILSSLYETLPSDRELRLAKSSAVQLVSLSHTREKPQPHQEKKKVRKAKLVKKKKTTS